MSGRYKQLNVAAYVPQYITGGVSELKYIFAHTLDQLAARAVEEGTPMWNTFEIQTDVEYEDVKTFAGMDQSLSLKIVRMSVGILEKGDRE